MVYSSMGERQKYVASAKERPVELSTLDLLPTQINLQVVKRASEKVQMKRIGEVPNPFGVIGKKERGRRDKINNLGIWNLK